MKEEEEQQTTKNCFQIFFEETRTRKFVIGESYFEFRCHSKWGAGRGGGSGGGLSRHRTKPLRRRRSRPWWTKVLCQIR